MTLPIVRQTISIHYHTVVKVYIIISNTNVIRQTTLDSTDGYVNIFIDNYLYSALYGG